MDMFPSNLLLARRFLKALCLSCAVIAIILFAQNSRAVIRDGGIDSANLGKGDWIYILPNAENQMGGNVPAVTNRTSMMRYFKNQGMQYIIIKSAEGAGLFPSAGAPQFTANLVNEAHATGLKIFGYNRNRGDDIPGEIAMVDYVFNLGADGGTYTIVVTNVAGTASADATLDLFSAEPLQLFALIFSNGAFDFNFREGRAITSFKAQAISSSGMT